MCFVIVFVRLFYPLFRVCDVLIVYFRVFIGFML